jgi:hypothetical protein
VTTGLQLVVGFGVRPQENHGALLGDVRVVRKSRKDAVAVEPDGTPPSLYFERCCLLCIEVVSQRGGRDNVYDFISFTRAESLMEVQISATKVPLPTLHLCPELSPSTLEPLQLISELRKLQVVLL